MKILFITNTPLGESSLPAMYYPLVILSAMGHSITIIGRPSGDSQPLIERGVSAIEAKAGASWFKIIRNVARDFQPDIVHVFIHAGCGLYPLLIKSVAKAKFVLDIRSPLLRHGLLRTLIRLKNRLEIWDYDEIFTVGHSLTWTVLNKRHFMYQGRTLHWLPSGVDLEAIPKARKHPEKTVTQSPLQLVYIGHLSHKRKIPQMVDAVIRVAQSYPVHLDIYGSGDDKPQIKNQIQQNNGSHFIRCLDVIPRNELFDRLVNYDIGLSYIPNDLYSTGPPLKTIEYLANNLPVVATNTEGNAIFIKDGENGLLVDEDTQSFSDGILRLAQSPELREKMIRNARSSVEAYDWTHIVKKHLLPVYEQLVE